MLDALRARFWSWLTAPRVEPDEVKILADLVTLNLPGGVVYIPTGWSLDEYSQFLIQEQRERRLTSGHGESDRLNAAAAALGQLQGATPKRDGVPASDCATAAAPEAKAKTGIRCTFCNTPIADAAIMITGASGAICSECVVLCVDVMSKALSEKSRTVAFDAGQRLGPATPDEQVRANPIDQRSAP